MSNLNKRYTYIDGLRGIASISVLFFHLYAQLTKTGEVHLLPEPLHFYFMHGDYGVQIFFVLSGFVIAHSIWKEGVTLSYVGNFALRRSLRLDPPYWIVIVLSYVALYTSRNAIAGSTIKLANGWEFVQNLFYLDNITGAQSIVPVGWTLQLEVQFYLIFIFLLFFNGQLKNYIRIENFVLWALFVPLFLFSVAVQYGFIANLHQGLFFPYWSMFFIGAIAYWIIDKRVSPIWIAVYVFLMIGVHWVGSPKDWGDWVAIITVISILIVSYFDKLYTFLSNPVIQYLGSRSYSIYLIHPLVGNRIVRLFVRKFPQAVTDKPWLSLAAFVVATILSLIAAEILYRVIEKQSVKFATKFRPQKA